jgi:hypothetical protein
VVLVAGGGVSRITRLRASSYTPGAAFCTWWSGMRLRRGAGLGLGWLRRLHLPLLDGEHAGMGGSLDVPSSIVFGAKAG